MNKLFSKIAALSVGLAMAIGVGVAVGSNGVKEARAAGTDTTTYSLINNVSDLEAGKSYIITSGTSGTVNAISTESNNNNRKVTSVSVSSGLITRGSSVMSFTLGGTSGAWTFATENYGGTNGYLSSDTNKTSSKNYLLVVSTASTATISFSGDEAVINIGPHNTRTQIRYNNANSLFSCYSSGQQAVYLWKEAGAATSFSVTYDGNGATGGAVPVDENTYESGDKATVLGNTGNLEKTGYTFSGWTYNSQTYQAGDKVDITSSVTLTAKWYKNDYISVKEGKENNNIYNGKSLVLSSCVTAEGDGALSFDVDTSVAYIESYDADTYTLTAHATNVGGPLTITAHKGSETAQFNVSVIEKSTSGDEYALFEADTLEEGDYLLVYAEAAMKAQISSDRLNYEEVAIDGESIFDPDDSLVWHIEASGDYWTLYNESTSKYAGSNAKNKAALVDEIGDNAKWTVHVDSATYDFENLARSTGSDSNNKWLRKNSTYGFACYASGTGGALSLYKKTSSVVTPSVKLDKEEVELYTTSTEGVEVTATAKNFTGTPVFAWSTENTNITLVNSNSVSVTIKSNTTVEGSASVKVKVHDNGASVAPAAAIEKTVAVTITLPEKGSDASNPYTVAEARAAIDASGTLENKFVKGIICQIDNYNETYKSITYWISDDGSKSNMLEVYSGKGLNGADFSGIGDISLKYTVVVNGTLKKFNTTYEFDKTSSMVSYTAPQVQSVDSVKSSPASVYVGQSVLPSEVILNVTYVGGSKDELPATSIELNTSVAASNVQGKAYYGEVGYATFTINVLEQDFSGTHVLTIGSSHTDYVANMTNEIFHEQIEDSEAFTLSESNNFRLNGNGHPLEFMFYGSSSVKLTAPANYVITTVVMNAYGGDDKDATFSVGGVAKTIAKGTTFSDYSYYVFGNSVVLSGASRVYAHSITITLAKYVPANLASAFESAFIELTNAECAAKAVTEENWNNIAKIFSHIENDFSDAATILKNETTAVDAIARYKVIIEKYGYSDFLTKGYVKLSSYYVGDHANDNTSIIVIVIAATSALAFTTLLVFKKKRQK